MTEIEVNIHSSIKIIGNQIVYFDPYQIKEENHDADYIFITHDHYDHFDIESIKKIMKENTKFIIPEKMKNLVENYKFNALYVLPNKQYIIDKINFSTVSSYNIDKTFHPKENDWVGYIIIFDDKTYYIPGDTDVLKENENISVNTAFIPIGGKFTMNYEEAAKFINKIKPRTVIPIHYGSLIGDISLGEKFASLVNKNIECILKIR